MAKLTITQLSVDDRPREKMMMHGARSLSNAELLAILIGSGNTEETAIELSQRILNSVDNSLHQLGKYDLKALTAYKGIGEAKAITILAAMELGRRRREEDIPERPVLNTSAKVYDYMKQRLADLPHEEFWTILLNRAGRVIDSIKISQGGTASATVESKLILRAAIQSLASAIILCHNHPSGTCKPSREDMSITRRIKDAAQLVEVSVVDHVIICDKKYYSFADNGDI
ncbi:MAG: DNA repair protein RadC [Bacteroidaceae bacterium]|nr:DNA repair protein RadC [Bacteroidaceae bacterium]